MKSADGYHVGNSGGLVQCLDLLIHSLFFSQKHGPYHRGVPGGEKRFQNAAHAAFQLPESLSVMGIAAAGAGNGGLP